MSKVTGKIKEKRPPEPKTTAGRLKRFDALIAGQEERNQSVLDVDSQDTGTTNRGWTREELYNRDRPRRLPSRRSVRNRGIMSHRSSMKDARGTTVKVGDRVRIIGTPDLSGMSPETRSESEPVFQHLVGTYKRIAEIDSLGNARILFRIKGKKQLEHHWAGLEPHLIQKPRTKGSSNKQIQPIAERPGPG